MSDVVPKYRYQFSCSEHGRFTRVSVHRDLQTSPCPECRKEKTKGRTWRTPTVGDGEVSDATLKSEKDALAWRQSEEYQEYIALKRAKSWGTSPEAKVQNKAIDHTADIVMADYKLGDISDKVHKGETMAPKLAPALQKQADNFFAPKSKGNMPFDPAKLAKQALAGKFTDRGRDPVKMLKPEHRPNVNVIASYDGRK